MIDHATCYGIRVHTRPTRSDSLVNNLPYKKKKKIFKGYSRLCIAAKVSSLYSDLLYGAVWEIAIYLIHLSTL